MTFPRLALPDWPYVAAGGLLVLLAYPPFHFIIPSFVCLVPGVWLVLAGQDDPRPFRRQLIQGFWYGFAAHGLVLYWMVMALWHFTSLSALGYVSTVAILALETGIVFAASAWVTRTLRWPLVLTLPLAWTAMEWFIGRQGDIRFPWLGLGTSLTGFPVLVQVADLVGARGVTFLLVMANTGLALAWVRRADRPFVLRSVAALIAGLLLVTGYGAWRLRSTGMRVAGRVAVLQPSEFEKWNRTPDEQDQVLFHLLRLTQRAAEDRPDLIAWPEASIPNYFISRPEWEGLIGSQVAQHRIQLVAGGVDYSTIRSEPYNAAFFFDSTGSYRGAPVYHKRELVPIVERVPFVNPRWFSGLKFFGAFGRGEPGPVYRAKLGGFGVLICYESAFEELTRDYRNRNADFIVNITNDSWFGHTAAPYQHAAHLVMRAIENRVGIARAANNGISEFVDPLGRAYQVTRLDDTTVVTDSVRTTDVRTVYTRVGDWVGLLSLAGTVVMVGLALRASRRPSHPQTA